MYIVCLVYRSVDPHLIDMTDRGHHSNDSIGFPRVVKPTEPGDNGSPETNPENVDPWSTFDFQRVGDVDRKSRPHDICELGAIKKCRYN